MLCSACRDLTGLQSGVRGGRPLTMLSYTRYIFSHFIYLSYTHFILIFSVTTCTCVIRIILMHVCVHVHNVPFFLNTHIRGEYIYDEMMVMTCEYTYVAARIRGCTHTWLHTYMAAHERYKAHVSSYPASLVCHCSCNNSCWLSLVF